MHFFQSLFCFSSNISKANHILTVLIHRHGARNPGKLFKREIFGGVKNELTIVGKEQMKELGKKWHEKLIKTGIISGNPENNDSIFISSPKERAILSLQSFLEGFYGNENKMIEWIPTEIDSIRLEKLDLCPEKKCLYYLNDQNDIIFHGHNPKVCDYNRKLKESNVDYPEYQKYLNRYQKGLFKEMAKIFNKEYNTTFNITNIGFNEFSIMNDCLYSAEYHEKFPLPGVPHFNESQTKEIRFAKFIHQFIVRLSNPDLRTQASNAIFTMLKQIIDEKIIGKSQFANLKYLHFSGHDTSMAGILYKIASMKEYKKREDNFIPYASGIEINFFSNHEGEVSVEFNFNDEPLLIRDKSTNILSLKETLELLEEGINENYGEVCKMEFLLK